MKKQFQSKAVPRGTRTIWRYLSALIILFSLSIGQMWGEDVTVDLALAKNTDPSPSIGAIIGTNYSKSNFDGTGYKIGSDNNSIGWDISASGKTFTAVTFNGYINTTNTSKNWGFKFSTDGGTTWGSELTQANDGTKSYHDISVTVAIPSGANAIQIIRKAGTSTYVSSITLTLAASCTAPDAPTISGTTSYTEGQTIELTASCASGADASTTYTWYEGADWATASAASPVQAAAVAGDGGNVFTKTAALADNGKIYWCEAANSTCVAHSAAGTEIAVAASAAAKHDITYTNTKGADNSANPTQYTEGIGVASFEPLADVTDFHFTGWSPASIAADATTDQTIDAQWVAAYNVTFNAGAGSGTVPTSFQKWEGGKFNLPGQGSMTHATKVFDGWKANGAGDKLAADAEYTMGNADVEFVAQWKAAPVTIFHWKSNTGTITIDAANGTTTGGTTTLRTTDPSKSWGSESVTYNASVAADMKGETSGKELKPGGNANYLELTLTSGTFQEGDVIYVTGYNNWAFLTSAEGISSATSFDVANVETGSGKGDAVTGSATIPAGIDAATIYARRANGSSSGIAAIKVTRIVKDIISTVNTLTDVKVGESSISAANLATLVSEHSLALSDALASAPTITFNKHTVVTYDDASTKTTDTPIDVTASDNGAGKWTASTTIDAVTYTVTLNKVSAVTVSFYDGATKLGDEVVAVGGYATASEITTTREHYTFNGWFNDAGLSDGPVNLASTAINANKDFYGSWSENAKAAVTFRVDEVQYGAIQNVYVGEKVASVNSPSKSGNVFQGWYNGESKFDFAADIASGDAITLDAKWAAADPNHFVYAYNDDFHFDGVVYKTPEGAVDAGSGTSNIAMTTPYTLFEGAEGITSIVITDGIYDSKTGAIQAVTALMKVNNNATSKLTVTIKSGYTATLKIKSSGYSATRTINVSDATPASGTTTGQAVTSGAMSVSGIGELSFALNSGSHDLTVTGGTLYIAELDIEATALPAHTVTYMPGEGTGAVYIIDDDATEVSDGSTMFTAPEGKIFNGWKDGDNNDVEVGTIVTGDMTLTAQWINHYAVTFNLQGHGDAIDPQDIKEGAKATKPADPVVMGWDFGGWFTDAECTAGNEFDFNTPITVATPLFAKWTAFEGCALLYPALSGSALNVGDNIDLQFGSKGGSIQVVGMKEAGSIAYNERGLLMGGGSADIISVTLNNDMDIDTKITVTLDAKGGGRPRGLYLLNGTGGAVKGGTLLGWNTPGDAVAEGTIETFSYTVEDADGLAGTNVFRLKRQNSTYIKCIKVESCGAAITYHNLTSEVNIAGKGTVALGATSVREGYTTTAEYTITDPLYEFVNWTVSGAGASVENATANPATITVGTEDAVVTLNLQLIPVKFTVNYYDGETPMGTELVPVNEHPTASEINTNKRHYTFQGWAETDGGSVVDLNTITRTEATTVDLYAVYAPVACPTSGTIFSMVFDDTKRPSSTVKVAKNGTLDAGEYATISGGTATFVNTETSDKDAISTDGKFKLTATKEVMKIELECVLQEGDIIRVPDNNAKYVISTSDSKTGTYQAQTSSQHNFAVTAAWAGVDDIYVLYDGSSLSFTQIEVYRRPALTGASLADLTIRQGQTKTPELTLEPSSDAIVNSQVWEIVGTPVNLIGAAIDEATGAITTGTLDDPASNGTISVKVTLNGSIEATCTATVVDAIMQQDVTKSIVWDWHNTGVADKIQLTSSTDPKKNENFVLANVAINNNANFESDKLVVEGEFMVREGGSANPYFQGQLIKFHTTVAGVVRVKFSHTGSSKPARELFVNGVGTGDSRTQATGEWSRYVEVPAGDVSLTAFHVDPADGAGQQYIRVFEIEFFEVIDSRTDYTARELGTACYEYDALIIGAKAYEVAGADPHGYMAFDGLEEDEALEAGKPYLFEADGGKIFFCKPVGATADPVDEEIAVKGMKGTFNPDGFDLVPGNGNYCYFSGRHIWRVNDFSVSKITVPTHRCYVDYDVLLANPVSSPNPAPGRRRVILGVNGEQVATGVENVQRDDVQTTKVLINGELYILRGEKMYDATGRLVK